MNFDVVKQLVAYGREQEKLHDKHFRFTLTTNGVLLNDDIMEFANKEMDNVVLSIDGRKEVNDRMRPFRKGAGSYDLIVPKFQKLAESRNQERYYVRGTYTHFNTDFSKDVLHADWHDVWHSPHPPVLIVFCNFLVFNVFTCFMRISPLSVFSDFPSICVIIAQQAP